MYIDGIQQKQQKLIKKITITGSQHTKKKYNTAFNNFNTYLEQCNITTIDAENIDDILIDYLATLNDTTLSNNTINQYMILIKKFITKECKIQIEKIPLLKTEKKEPKYINLVQYQEVQKFLDQQILLENTRHKQQILKMDKLIIQLLFNTGLRIHEALKITIDELTNATKDKNNIYQLDVIGKGNKKRTIFISDTVYESLMQYIQEYNKPGNTYIFESNKKPHTPVTTMTIERHFQQIAKEIDAINDTDADDKNSYQELLKPHNLRHSFAVVKLEQGININAMQEFLGHSNITTTQIYTRLNNDSLSDEMAKTL